MKRIMFTSLMFAAAAAYLGLAASPALALNNPPPLPTPADNCTEVEVVPTGPVVWPAGPHSYFCGTATQADATKMVAVLRSLAAKTETEMVGLAGSTTRGNFYLFGKKSEYDASSLAAAYGHSNNPGAAALTINAGSGNIPPIFTAVWKQNGYGDDNQFLENAVAHELGHWFDALNGAAMTKSEQITLNGPVTAGHQISLTIANGNLPGGAVTVSATVVAGDTLSTLATKLRNAVNALANANLNAVSAGVDLTVNYVGNGSGPTYSYSVTGAGALEQVWLDTGPKVSDQAFFKHSLHGPNPETATISGTIAVGSKFTFNFREPTPPVGPVLEGTVTYTTVAGDTPTTIATAVKNLINANLAVQVTATSAGSVITITSISGNTDYSATVVKNASETVTLLGDIPRFNQAATCNVNNVGIFTGQRDRLNEYICSTSIQGAVGGGPYVAGTITLTVQDASLPGGSQNVQIMVNTNESSTSVATRLANQVNTQLNANYRISASSFNNSITLVSSSGKETTYAFAGGATLATLQLQNPQHGRGSALFTKRYSAVKSNWTNLTVTAWPDFYTPDREVVAEYYAVLAGYNDRSFPPNNAPNNESLDWYLQFNPGFTCIKDLMITIANTRLRPTGAPPAGCPAN